jgi:hypothetical protein
MDAMRGPFDRSSAFSRIRAWRKLSRCLDSILAWVMYSLTRISNASKCWIRKSDPSRSMLMSFWVRLFIDRAIVDWGSCREWERRVIREERRKMVSEESDQFSRSNTDDYINKKMFWKLIGVREEGDEFTSSGTLNLQRVSQCYTVGFPIFFFCWCD